MIFTQTRKYFLFFPLETETKMFIFVDLRWDAMFLQHEIKKKPFIDSINEPKSKKEGLVSIDDDCAICD